MKRRTFLEASLALTATAVALPWAEAVAREDATPITATSLAEGLWLFQGAGGNVVVSRGSDGLLMVDGGSVERSPELLKRVMAQTGGRRVEMLVNTHWHWDHTGSNEAVAKSGGAIFAHENTKLWLGTEVISKWENRTYPPRPARALPTKTFFYGGGKLDFRGQDAGEDVEYGYLPQAHTDGDIYVRFPKANVIVAGDVVSGGGNYPIADYCTNGWLGGMMQGLKLLVQKSDADTKIIPGSGPIRSRADLEAQRDVCYQVLQRIGDSYYKGQTWKQLLESRPTREFDAKWGNPDAFLKTAYEGAWLHVNEIRRVQR
ncbi:MAG TPA: MBL fold metallo-hydrolase [Steroidobacteraceae bacterium]